MSKLCYLKSENLLASYQTHLKGLATSERKLLPAGVLPEDGDTIIFEKLVREYSQLHKMPENLKKYPEIFEKVIEDKYQFEMEFVSIKCAVQEILAEISMLEEQTTFKKSEISSLNAEIADLDKLIRHYGKLPSKRT